MVVIIKTVLLFFMSCICISFTGCTTNIIIPKKNCIPYPLDLQSEEIQALEGMDINIKSTVDEYINEHFLTSYETYDYKLLKELSIEYELSSCTILGEGDVLLKIAFKHSGAVSADYILVFHRDDNTQIYQEVFREICKPYTEVKLQDITGDGLDEIIITHRISGNGYLNMQLSIYSYRYETLEIIFQEELFSNEAYIADGKAIIEFENKYHFTGEDGKAKNIVFQSEIREVNLKDDSKEVLECGETTFVFDGSKYVPQGNKYNYTERVLDFKIR